MFIRTKRTPRSNSISIQLVEAFRENGKIKQRVVRHVGTAETPEKIEELKQLAIALKAELLNEKLCQTKLNDRETSSGQVLGELRSVPDETLLHANSLEESARYILGIHDIYGYVYKQIGFTNPFYNPARRVFAAKILREVVLARIANPKSKRGSVAWLRDKCGIDINLDHVYQMMDKIDDKFCERIQRSAFESTLKLTGEKLQVLFYDATTLYFESFVEDELKCNGYSKDMEFNQAQVLLALYVTEKGLPIGYDLYPGNQYEGHTLIPALKKLKEHYGLAEIIVVADSGLLSKENLKYLDENNFKYIVGARLKSLSPTLQADILNLDSYQLMNNETGLKCALFSCCQGRQLIVNYSPERARKDEYERQKAITKLQKKLKTSKDPKSLVNNYGYKKYLEIEGEVEIKINQEKLEKDAQWDGLHGVITNVSDPNPVFVLSQYHGLWQVEESFRINKTDLKMRPIYHWTPQRIKAYIAIAFMAFVCVRYLEYRVSVQSRKLSPEVIREALLDVQASIIKDNKSGKEFVLPSKINAYAKEIYRVLRIKNIQRMAELKRSD